MEAAPAPRASARAGWAVAFLLVGGVLLGLLFLRSSQGERESAPDLTLSTAGRDGQATYEGLHILQDDDGLDTQPPQLSGHGVLDRWVAVQSTLDAPITVAEDPAAVREAGQRNATLRLGFLPDRTTQSYPHRVEPALRPTIPARASGLLVLRVRVGSCANPSEDEEPIAGGIRVVDGPGAPRELRVAERATDGSVHPEPARQSTLPVRLQVLVPGCPGGG